MTSKERYFSAHKEHFAKTYVNAFNDGHYFTPDMPKLNTSNGLTNAICNYLKWVGGIGNRINVAGRLVDRTEKTESGQILTSGKKFIKSTTIKGTSDIIAQLPNGKVLNVEIKVGNDKPRPAQIEMQQRVRKANGNYEFVHNLDEFFYHYDRLMFGELFL